MNKKFLSAILFGALMVSSTGTFVSCKDYDDDIDNINKELTDIKSKLSDLESKVTTGGAYVTKIESVEGGLKVSVSDGTSYNLTIAGTPAGSTVVIDKTTGEISIDGNSYRLLCHYRHYSPGRKHCSLCKGRLLVFL